MSSGHNETRLRQNGKFWRSLFRYIRMDKMQGIEGEGDTAFYIYQRLSAVISL